MVPQTCLSEDAYSRVIQLKLDEKLTLKSSVVRALQTFGYRIEKSTISRNIATLNAAGQLMRSVIGRPTALTNEQERHLVDECSHFAYQGGAASSMLRSCRTVTVFLRPFESNEITIQRRKT